MAQGSNKGNPTSNDRTDKLYAKTRKHIQEQIEKAEEDHKKKLKVHRIDLAKNGVRLYKEKKYGEAVRAFQQYIRILEEIKGVGEGHLHPSNFDKKLDLSELVLISGIFWDLTKLFDRTKSETRQTEFRHYMEKFILFSKGMPFEALSAETLRKYILAGKPMRKTDFKHAYRVLSGSKCFIATSLIDHLEPETLPILRAWREHVWRPSAAGRFGIWVYERIGPHTVPIVDHLPEYFRKILSSQLDLLASRISKK